MTGVLLNTGLLDHDTMVVRLWVCKSREIIDMFSDLNQNLPQGDWGVGKVKHTSCVSSESSRPIKLTLSVIGTCMEKTMHKVLFRSFDVYFNLKEMLFFSFFFFF